MTAKARAFAAVFGLAVLGVGCTTAAPPSTKLVFAGSVHWPASVHGFGGFSGLEVWDNGTRFVALSDAAGVVSDGRLTRDNGRLTGVSSGKALRLTDEEGAPLMSPRHDAEGLARREDGALFVSFEGEGRVWRYAGARLRAALPSAPAFAGLQGNSGLEALAIDAEGRLYTLPERSGQLTRPFPVWRFDNGTWRQPYALRREGNFLPVGMDFGPDGHLYLLERAFSGFAFRSRLRRFRLRDDRIVGEEVLRTTRAFRHDNLEGLSVWRDDAGDIRLTMISDDNFNAVQRTQIVEYRLLEAAKPE